MEIKVLTNCSITLLSFRFGTRGGGRSIPASWACFCFFFFSCAAFLMRCCVVRRAEQHPLVSSAEFCSGLPPCRSRLSRLTAHCFWLRYRGLRTQRRGWPYGAGLQTPPRKPGPTTLLFLGTNPFHGQMCRRPLLHFPWFISSSPANDTSFVGERETELRHPPVVQRRSSPRYPRQDLDLRQLRHHAQDQSITLNQRLHHTRDARVAMSSIVFTRTSSSPLTKEARRIILR